MCVCVCVCVCVINVISSAGYKKMFDSKIITEELCGGARGVVVIVVGNGQGDTSSNPGRD